MTNELYLKRDDVLNLFEEYQPRLATHVSEFGDALEDLKFRALESQPCEDCISKDELYKALDELNTICGTGMVEKAVTENNINWLKWKIDNLPSVTPSIKKWLSSFNTDSATECFTAVQRLKEAIYENKIT